MPEVINLKEYEPTICDLAEEDLVFLRAAFDKRITVQRNMDGPGYWLNPNQFVGILTLPTGQTIRCSPKVPVQSLFYMLAVVLDYAGFRPETAKIDRLEHLLEFVAEHFAGLIEGRISRGLYRAYVTREENLAFIRGRIDFTNDIRQNYILRQRTYCRFEELTWDVPENQVLRQVIHLLSGWDFTRALRNRLAQLDATLHEVSPSFMAAADVSRFTYHRLNEDYRPLHQLCQLFLQGASLSEVFGEFNYRTFLLDMNVLFETFVSRVLEQRVPALLTLQAQYDTYLDDARNVGIVPDLVVQERGVSVLVADCKYKKVAEGEYKNHDLYQVISYCLALGTSNGLLIYPKHLSEEVRGEVQVRNSGIRIEQVSIDLSGDWAGLQSECQRLAQRVYSRVRSALPVAV